MAEHLPTVVSRYHLLLWLLLYSYYSNRGSVLSASDPAPHPNPSPRGTSTSACTTESSSPGPAPASPAPGKHGCASASPASSVVRGNFLEAGHLMRDQVKGEAGHSTGCLWHQTLQPCPPRPHAGRCSRLCGGGPGRRVDSALQTCAQTQLRHRTSMPDPVRLLFTHCHAAGTFQKGSLRSSSQTWREEAAKRWLGAAGISGWGVPRHTRASTRAGGSTPG